MSKENQLSIIVKDSGLETTKAKVILEKFHDYFDLAAEWEVKAKNIVVTDEKQIADMKMARIGRLELREKRIAIEKTRKELKEQALREGKAIDGIANILKGIIVPIEEYLDHQEKFIVRKKAAEAEQKRIEGERLVEEKRIADEKAEAERIEKERLENIQLRKEADVREKKLKAVQGAADKKLADERRVSDEKLRKQQEESERKRKALEEKAETERIEKERIQAKLDAQIECPYCHEKFNLEEEWK